jgi:anti-sigma B factor antagonist
MDLFHLNPQQIQYLEIIGRVDNKNVGQLADTLDEAITQGRNEMVLDMSGVTFINSAGLRELVRIFKRVQRVGGMLHILNPSDQVQRLLDLVGLDSVFDIDFDPTWNFAPTKSLPDAAQRQICYLA